MKDKLFRNSKNAANFNDYYFEAFCGIYYNLYRIQVIINTTKDTCMDTVYPYIDLQPLYLHLYFWATIV